MNPNLSPAAGTPPEANLQIDLLVGPEIERAPAPTPATAVAPPRMTQVLLATGVLLIAINLRPVFASLSVVLPEIMAATGLSPAGASLLTILPIVCLGVFAMLAPPLARRFGIERVLLGCMVLITAGTLLRGTGSLPVLFAASAMAGSGIAVANVLMASLIKRDFARHAALMMGLYTTAVCGGAAIAAGLTIPLERAFASDWTLALGFWAVPAAITTLLWAFRALPQRPPHGQAAMAVRGLWGDPLAWQVTLFMGLQSSLAYIAMGWLAPILRERGLQGITAGYVVSLAVITQVVTCLVVPPLAARRPNQVGIAVAVTLLTVVSLLALLFAPLGGVWFWAVMLGIAQGGSFALALTMIVLRSPDPHVAAQLSAMAQGVGYLIAAVGPLATGVLRGWTGSFDACAVLFVLVGAALLAAGAGAGRARHVAVAATERIPG